MTAINIPPVTRTYRRPDIEAIKRLSAKEVAERLGLVEQTSATHYKFSGYEGSAWIRFYEDKWFGFKHNDGGDCISIVQASMSGAPDFTVDGRLFLDACSRIASAFDLWAEPPHSSARQLAKTKYTYDDARAYLSAVAKTIESDNGGRPWAVASRVFDALDLDPDCITLNPDSEGTGCLCWQPITPWQDVRISTVTKNINGVDRTIFGGWTIERAEAHLHRPDSMRIIMHDFDGINAQGIKPKIEHIEHIVRMLQRRGLGPATVIWSSYGDEDEAKAHMYWKMERAGNFAQWLRRWTFLRDQIIAIASESFSPSIAATLVPDTCTKQIQRIFRVPGYTPYGKDMAATIHSCHGNTIDIDGLMERRDVTWRSHADDKTFIYTLGEQCTITTEVVEESGNVNRSTYCVAHNIWPVARWVDGKDMGLVVRLERNGETVYTHLRGGQLVERKSRSKVVIDLANIGAQIMVGGDKNIGNMIANAYQWQPVLVDRVVELETRPGWHGGIYVQSEGIFEDEDRAFLATGDRIRRRGHTRGTTEQWVEEVAVYCSTQALCIGLLTSFAGALVRRTGQHPFIVHMHCRSSQGKSSASAVAASVWGPGEVSGQEGLYYSWNVTATYPEVIAEAATDACAIMDDTSKWRGTDEDLANVVHLLGGTMGRGRCFQTGEGQPLRRWYCTTLSNGEVGLLDQIGGAAIGGHYVRVLDVEIGEGECAIDAQHADLIRRAAAQYYGSVSVDWIKAIQHISDEDLTTMLTIYVDKVETLTNLKDLSSEQQRVKRIIALMWMVGNLLIDASLVKWTHGFLETCIYWLCERTLKKRHNALDTPEHRYAERLLNYIDEDERHAPWITPDDKLSATPSRYVGYRKGERLYLLKSRLKAIKLTKEISGVDWLQWAKTQPGLVIEHKRIRMAEENRNFWVLNLESLESLAGVY